MSINFQEILKELEYRVEHGIIDLNKEEQVTKLVKILRENGVSDANAMAQKARVYYSYLNEAKQSLDKVLKQSFKNPETGNQVTVASALGYKKNSAAYTMAKNMMATAGYSEKDIDMVDAGPDDEEKPVKPKSNVFGKDKGGKVFEPNTVTVTDDKQKSDKVHSTLYPSDKIQKGKVMGESKEGDNQVKNDMLKYGFGGYKYQPGRWKKMAEDLIRIYDLNNDSKILDVGCGDAQIRSFLGDVNYVGVDHNPKYIAKAREANGLSDEFYVADVSEVAQLVTNKFDRVLLIGVLHHLSDSQCQDLIRNCAQLLATNGHLFAIDPALIDDQHPIARFLAKSDRGRFARSPDDYRKLIQEEFASVVVTVRHDLLRIPYSHSLIVAKNF